MGVCLAVFSPWTSHILQNTVLSHTITDILHAHQAMAPKRKLLFLTNREHGAANVHLAVSYEILTQYPGVEVHFASFAGLQKHVRAVSSQASKLLPGEAPGVSPIIFHALPGSSITETVAARFGASFQEAMTHPPGVAGAVQSYKRVGNLAASWPGEEHLKIYAATAEVIQEVNPALVILDPVFIPGVEACRKLQAKYAMLSPNAMKDLLVQQQPRGEIFWKYPA